MCLNEFMQGHTESEKTAIFVNPKLGERSRT